MIPSGWCVLWGALMSMVILGGCATLPPPREAGRPVSREEQQALLARLRMREDEIRALRGFAAVEITLNEERWKYREAIALRGDGRFRLDTLGPFGLPVLIIASDGNRVVVHRTADQAGGATDGDQLLDGLLGLELPPAALARLLSGLPPRPIYPSPFVAYLPERQAYLVEDEDHDALQRLYLDPSGALLGGEVWRGGDGLRFGFGAVREVDGIALPTAITLIQAHRPVRVEVIYQTVEINPILADRLFIFPEATRARDGSP